MGRMGIYSLAVMTLFGVISQIPGSSSLAVMSIDLGSEWLKIAIVKPGVPMEIVLNKESRRKTPVVISLKDEDLQISDPALSVATRYPKSAYFYLQDLLAKSLDSPLVKTFQKRFPYYELMEDEERGTVIFKHSEDVNYSPEELLAIILNKSREIAQDFAEQPIKDVVITVPVFFNQAERKTIMYAAELAGLKVLQLMNSNTAVALNYGVFRRNDFNATPTNIMFYDLGASSAVATIVSYQVAKTKEKGVSETNPQLSIKGVGYDRTLGGLEMEFRLRDHLAKLFTKQKKTSNSVYDSPRAMAKLFKEAKRVKKVLSANVDHFSQIEGLLDDKDFSASKISRAELEEMNSDLFERIDKPIKDALQMSEMTMGEIDQVILMGGSSRVPKVQEILMKATGKKELGKNINADEAAAMGAVYQAAYLGKGFKVKKFVIKDANLYPIQVSFQRTVFGEDGEEDTIKTVKRTLFGRNNPFPQKKVMTFNRHTGDFTFSVGYNDLEQVLSEEDLKNFGSVNLTTYSLSGVADALEKNSEAESKGIKAHFRMDDSGLLYLDSVESVFEKTEQVMEEVNDTDGQSTFAKLSSTITNFFSGGAGEDGEQTKLEDGPAETEKEEDGSDEDVPPSEDKEEPAKTEDSSKESDDKTADEDKDEKTETAEEDKDEKAETSEEDPAATTEAEEKSESEEPQQAQEETEEKEDTKEEEEVKEKETTEEDKSSDEEKEEKEEKVDSDGEETKQDDDKEKTTEKEKSSKKKKKDKEDDKKEDDDEKKEKIEKKKVAKPKVVTIKENITVAADVIDIADPSKESKKSSRNKLKELKKKETAKKEKEEALNNLESFIYLTKDKLYSDAWEECSVDEEREHISTNLNEASDWLYEQPDDAEASIYKDKQKELKKLVKDLKFRVKEQKERPELAKALKDAFNYSVIFLKAARNFTEEDSIFTDTEIRMLSDVYNETLAWYRTKSEEQENIPCTHAPVMLTSDMKDKYMKLDRELQYLYNKAKSQPKKKPKKAKKPKKSSNETETEENGANGEEEKVEGTNGEEEKQETEETVDVPPTDDDAPKDAPTDEVPTETQEEAPSEKKEEEQEEVLQLGADGLELPAEDEKPLEDKPTDSKEDNQSENSKIQTDQSDDTKSDHDKEPNAHNTGEL